MTMIVTTANGAGTVLDQRGRGRTAAVVGWVIFLGAVLAGGVARADVAYVSSDDAKVQKIASSGSGAAFTSAGLSHPTGLAFNSAGNLFVANTANSTVSKLSGTGTASPFVTSSAGPTGLAGPRHPAACSK